MNLSYVKPLYFSALILAVLLEPVIANDTIAAKEQSPKEANSPARRCSSSGSYCGIYCLYAVMKLSDIDVDPQELLKPEYIGSPRGSSLAELKKAAEDHGMYAAPVGKLTTRELRQSPYPIILHVKSAADRKEYDHYELFLETKDGQAKLYDPPQPVRLVPFYELAPRWDGTGLIVSTGPIDLGTVFAPARKRFITYAAIAIAVILGLRLARRHRFPAADTNSRRRLFAFSVAQGAGLAIAALLCGMVYHFVNKEGFLAHANATASIQKTHQANFIPKLGEKQTRKLLNTNTLFVDAGLNTDFETQHLKGAINVPVNASSDERANAMATVPQDARIVVYCLSPRCSFAENVAINLISDGFSDVSLFKGDWRKLIPRTNE